MPSDGGRHRTPRRSVASARWDDLDRIARTLGLSGAALASAALNALAEGELEEWLDAKRFNLTPKTKPVE